jgi:hypothetical protein
MAIKGSLDEASVPDVLQLLSLGKKTGCLSVTDWSSLGYIYVDQGRIIYATIVNRRDRLGDILVRSGRITQDQLDAAIHSQDRDRTKRLGELLVEQGAITRGELERHMRAQIEEAVYFFFTWRTGSFTFEADVRPERQDFLISIEPESLMLEGARRTDEWTLIEQKVPSFGIIFKLDQDRLASHQETLSDDQQRIAPLLNGKRDVGEIVDTTGLGEFAVGKALYELVGAGLAHPVARKESDRRLSATGVRVDDAPQVTVEEVAAPQHLDVADLLRYLARDGVFADAMRRRTAAFHIADCPTCSKRLKELHQRRTGEQSAVPARPADDAAPARPPLRSGERRTGVDRRKSDPRMSGSARRTEGEPTPGAGGLTLVRRTGLDRRDSDRRAATGGRRQSAAKPQPRTATQAAAVVPVDRRAAFDRRSWEERRNVDRRRGERREATSVDRTDRAAVERRSGKDRRGSERRTEYRRVADRAEEEAPPRRTVAAKGVRGASSAGAAKVVTPTQQGASPPRRGTSAKRSAPPQAAAASRPAKPVVMKEQSSTLEVPRDNGPAQQEAETRPRIFLTIEERKSLAGLPVVEMPGIESDAGTGAPAPVAKARPEPRRPPPDLTPNAEPPAPHVRSAVAKPAPRPVPALGEREAGVAGGIRPSAAQTSRRRTFAWGGVAAAALILGWFGRPMVQSLFGGSGGEGGGLAADVAALQIPGPPPAATATADSVASDSAVVEVRTAQARTDPPAPSPEPPRQEIRTPPVREAAPPPGPRAAQPEAPVVQAPVAQPAPPPAAAEPEPVARAAPTLAGSVRAQGSGVPLPGVRIGVEGTDLTATTDAQGAYRIVGTPTGSLTIAADLSGYMPATKAVTADSGAETRLDLALSRPPSPRDPDTELVDDQWIVTDAAEAATILGMPVAVVGGLWIEAIAKPASGSRPRIRVTQLTHSGDRVILVVARAGAPARQPNPRVTALRIIPASAAYPTTTGTASFGNLLVTAKTELPADSLRIQLGRLTEASGR